LIERHLVENLIKKAENEFRNVTLDTPDNTNKFERKIQGKLRDLYKSAKIDNKKRSSSTPQVPLPHLCLLPSRHTNLLRGTLPGP
jgi:hypothetical protein